MALWSRTEKKQQKKKAIQLFASGPELTSGFLVILAHSGWFVRQGRRAEVEEKGGDDDMSEWLNW